MRGDHPAPGHNGRAAAIKREVQHFYDELGWKKCDAVFSDAAIFEDLRAVTAQYQHDCHARVATHLFRAGAIFSTSRQDLFSMTNILPTKRL